MSHSQATSGEDATLDDYSPEAMAARGEETRRELIRRGADAIGVQAGQIVDHFSYDAPDLAGYLEAGIHYRYFNVVGAVDGIINILRDEGSDTALTEAIERLGVFIRLCPPISWPFFEALKGRDRYALGKLEQWRRET